VALAQKPNGGLIVPPGNNPTNRRGLIVALAGQHGLPALYSARQFVAASGLMSYDSDVVDLCSRAAGYVDRILKGENPADLPVQQSTKFELVVNSRSLSCSASRSRCSHSLMR
jgi:putative ABC transport system substrate-binding protein